MHDLLDGIDVVAIDGDLGVDVRSVEHDSRRVQPGALFACIRGARSDGHDYAAQASAAGAVALLVERDVPVDVPRARVESVRRVLGPVAARHHGDPSRAMRVLGVTGTNGKTTVTHVLEAIARAAGERPGRIGTLGTAIGDTIDPPVHTTPEATDLQASLATMRDRGVGTVAMEVSSHALEQHRVDGTHFAAVCYTNLSQDHLDYHGTMDAYFEAKARLFDGRFAPAAALTVDDPRGRELFDRANAAGLDVWTFSFHHTDADFTARDVECTADHTRFTLVSRRDGRRVGIESTTLLGDFNVANLLAGAATARAGGLSFEAVAAGLGSVMHVPGRFERVDDGGPFAVLVDYAHTPDALERVLSAGRMLARAEGRVAVVYGCGGDRDRAKRPLMGAAAARLADRAYLTSDNPRSEDPEAIAAEVLRGVVTGREPIVELDRRRAIRKAIADAAPGDVVIIAGKGHEPGQTIGTGTLPFDDREVAREELRGARCD
ncbi:MAG: UDP-N-acetylmuramoyl-L-alanyl-D-glutamate--2,6-diaminopimelate ligase [Acidimicrobiia bacterium]